MRIPYAELQYMHRSAAKSLELFCLNKDQEPVLWITLCEHKGDRSSSDERSPDHQSISLGIYTHPLHLSGHGANTFCCHQAPA